MMKFYFICKSLLLKRVLTAVTTLLFTLFLTFSRFLPLFRSSIKATTIVSSSLIQSIIQLELSLSFFSFKFLMVSEP
ncbi:hypothetical protein Patl1_10209 [Pistacia atlantica]|uniref:Uncharacterized protein n=1 Tax=Pistacia atlantica TaxID=434234 RepID=A0ACC1A691_9ROSI|nr:hypothetical protein Patl1_10209 [Pistacia atlantica]